MSLNFPKCVLYKGCGEDPSAFQNRDSLINAVRLGMLGVDIDDVRHMVSMRTGGIPPVLLFYPIP